MKIIRTKDSGYKAALKHVLERGETVSSSVEQTVRTILEDVRKRGDAAIIEYTKKFDNADVSASLRISKSEIDSAYKNIPAEDKKIMELAAKRISAFHKKQKQSSWQYNDRGITLGQKITPIERAGVYVPGGKAAYPSTVLMSAIPAKVAGVDKIVMVTPPSKDGMNPYVLAAAKIAGVDEAYRIGGAQAIGALAFGTKSVPKVDKIVGPGNIFVATAKRLVFGIVDIDMVAGPSEILIINDGTGKATDIAADLLSQAEHDELASSILVTTSSVMATKVANEVEIRTKMLKRRLIAEASIKYHGLIIIAKSLNEAFSISNEIAPEHLELYIKNADKYVSKVRNAGAIFIGRYTPEAAGDYLAGPNHTLPTGGTARFSSPLGTYDFTKASSIVGFSDKAIKTFGKSIARFADMEGLEAHAISVRERLGKSK